MAREKTEPLTDQEARKEAQRFPSVKPMGMTEAKNITRSDLTQQPFSQAQEGQQSMFLASLCWTSLRTGYSNTFITDMPKWE